MPSERFTRHWGIRGNVFLGFGQTFQLVKQVIWTVLALDCGYLDLTGGVYEVVTWL